MPPARRRASTPSSGSRIAFLDLRAANPPARRCKDNRQSASRNGRVGGLGLADRLRLLLLLHPEELVLVDLALTDLGLRNNVVDDLVLEDRGAQFGERLRILAVMIPDLLFLAGEGAGTLDQGLRHLIVVDLHLRFLADFGEQKPEPHAPLGNAAVIGARLVLARTLVGEALARLRLLGLDLLPNAFELLVDKAGRQLKRVFLVERVEKRPLQLLARGAAPLGFEIAADGGLHRFQRVEVEAFGERIVDGELARRGDALGGDVERRFLAREMPRQVILRERSGHGAAVTRLHAEDLILKAGNEGVGADDDIDIAAGAAFERLAADLADEVDGQLVALLCRGVFRIVGAVLVGHAIEHLLDLGFGHVGDQALQLEVVERTDIELGQGLEGDGEGEVALRLHHLFHLALTAREVEARLDGQAKRILLTYLLVGLGHRLLDAVAHYAA